MIAEKNSLIIKAFIPILTVLIIIPSITFLITSKIISLVKEENIKLFNERHSFEIKKILDKALTEVVTSQMLKQDIPILMTIKQNDVIEDINSYLQLNNLEGVILVRDHGIEKIVYSKLTLLEIDKIRDFTYRESHKILNNDIALTSILFPAWNWSIITVSRLEGLSETQRYVDYIIPVNLFGAFISLLLLWIIFNKQIIKNFRYIISSINQGNRIKDTNIIELDVLIDTINKSFDSLTKKNQHLQLLHDTLIKIQQCESKTDLLEHIVNISNELFDTEVAAITKENKNGEITLYLVGNRGLSTDTIKDFIEYLKEEMPLCSIALCLNSKEEIMQMIDNQDIIRDINNLYAQPINLKDTNENMVFYLFNKQNGFTNYDISLINIFISDLILLLNRLENLRNLRKFQRVIDSSFDNIIMTNSKGEIIYVNEAFEKITDYKKEEVIGKRPNILKSNHQNKEFYKDMWEKITSGQIWKGELINRKKNGELYHESAVIFPISFEGEINFVGIKRDITQEKKLYEQLMRAQKMEAIGTLAGGIAHDFNNILTAILGYSELMLNTTTESDKYYKPAKIINESAKKAAELTKKILTITRKEKLEAKAIQINDIIRDVLEIISHSFPKNIEIVTNLYDAMPQTNADPTQIHQVILNLCVNARDAMPDGGTLTIATSLVGTSNGSASDLVDLKGEFIKISVSDTGVGIDAETQQRVFDPFFTTKEKSKGTGLGLYIVHSIVTNHNGYINLYSEPHKGTRFNIYLPLTKLTDKDTNIECVIFKGAGVILLIDDEEDVRSVCKDILNALGYDVITATDGKDGIQKYIENKEKITAVILDMIMPRMGGNEVYKTLKDLNPHVKVIISSGFSQEGYAGIDKLIKDGALGFIQKPFTLNTLKAVLRQF